MPTTDGRLVLAEDDRTPRRRWVGRVLVAAVLAAVIVAGYAGYRALTRSLFTPMCTATASGSTVTFTPEQTANAALISAISAKRGLPPRAATIALATALQESKLRNLTYGDRDSVGLFQQRPSQGWGTREQILDAVYSTNKFYDALVKVKDYQTREITKVAQEVQRSAAPEAYADHEQEGRVLASTLTGHSPAGLGCRLKDVQQAADGAGVVADLQSQLGAQLTRNDIALTLDASSPEQAWAAGQWAVARAEAYGIDRVQVGDRAWERRDDSGSTAWVSATAGPTATTVTIRMGAPKS